MQSRLYVVVFDRGIFASFLVRGYRVMSDPKLTVCLPTFNKARYLPAAIESVLAQEFTDFELLIVNDASPDHTDEVVRKYEDSRALILRSFIVCGLCYILHWHFFPHS